MAFPKILLAVPIVVAGAMTPAVGHALDHPGPGIIGMNHEGYSVKSVTIHRGERLRFVNDSRYIHIIGAGKGGHLAEPGTDPIKPRLLMETNDSYVTGPWTTPGTYYMTCSVHPEMTIKVVVT